MHEYVLNPTRHKMPTERAIRAYWAEKFTADELARKGFFSTAEFMKIGSCMACGWETYLQRCHILARCYGGSDDASNLHMLCMECHYDSETIDGDVYWRWFWGRTHQLKCVITALRLGLFTPRECAQALLYLYPGEDPPSPAAKRLGRRPAK
jgi:hypothetical protein